MPSLEIEREFECQRRPSTMRNDVCFPCLEHPKRVFLLSVPADDNPKRQQDRHALSCNRKGEISSSLNRKRWEEWYLIPEDSTSCGVESTTTGVYRIINAAHNSILLCNAEGKICAKKPNNTKEEGSSDLFLEGDAGLWSIEENDYHGNHHPKEEGFVRIKSFAGNCFLSCATTTTIQMDGDSSVLSGEKKIATPSGVTPAITTKQDPTCSTTLWKMEYLTGELCYIHTSYGDNLIQCDNLGKLKLSSTWGGWEIWRFIEAGHNQVRISSWTHQHKLLCCDAFGQIVTTEERFSPGTLWKIQRAPPGGMGGVMIISAPTGRILRSDGKTISSVGYLDGVNTTWHLTTAHRDKYYLSSIGYDKRVSLIKDASILKTTEYRRDCEVWCLDKLENGFVMIRSDKFGRYLRYDGQGLSVTENKKQQKQPKRNSQQQQQRRSSSSDAADEAAGGGTNQEEEEDNNDDNDENEEKDEEEDEAMMDISARWRIVESPTGSGFCIVSACEPFLALSCNSKGELETVDHQGPFESWDLEPVMPHSLEGWQINLMIGGAVGAALLGPAIAVGMMGVGAEAAAGSLSVRAGILAAEVAATDSMTIGGLGLAAATAAMGTGAAVGLSATGIIIAASKRGTGEGTDLRQPEQDRPFCEWRSW